MKTITYEYEKMVRVGKLINLISFKGVEAARIIAEIGDILDSGKLGKTIETDLPGKGSEKDDVGPKEICPDKLEKPAVNGDSAGRNES